MGPSVPSRVILGLDEPFTDVLDSAGETFFGADMSDDEGIYSASRVAISSDQDVPTRHDD